MEKRDAYTALKEKVLDKILEGKERLVMWGFTSTCVQLLAELQSMGMLDRVSGVVDTDTGKQGQSVHHLTVISPQEGSNLPFDTLVITSDELGFKLLTQRVG